MKKPTFKKGLKSKLAELKETRYKHRVKKLSSKLDAVTELNGRGKEIQFQDYDPDVEAARRRHVLRTTLIGTGAGAAAFGGPAYQMLRKGLHVPKREAAAIAGLSALKGASVGTATGLGVGLFTRPERRRVEELSARLDDLIEFQPKPYSKAILESSWRNVNKPSRQTLGNILRRHGEYRNAPTTVFRKRSWILEGLKKVALTSILDDLINFQDPRPRDRLGQFEQQGEGGPDPNAMVRTYRTAPPKSPGLLNISGTAALVGASGTGGGLAVKALADQIKQLRKVRIR